MKKLEDYKDKYGFIGHMSDIGLEFGDGTQRIGQEAIALYALKPLERGMEAITYGEKMALCRRWNQETKKASYVRHWDDSHWPGSLWTMSRDNLDLFWKAAGLFAPHHSSCRQAFKEITLRLLQRGGFTWNWKHIWPKPYDEPKLPDWISPWDILQTAIRGFRMWYLWPLLLILDLTLLVNSLVRVVDSVIQPTETSNDLNHQGRLVFAQVVYWTPVAWLARHVYSLLRLNPKIRGEKKRMTGYAPLDAFKAYYRHDEAPPMDKVWEPVIERYV